MNNGWIDTFNRTNWENIDGKFSTNIMKVGNELPSRTQINDLKYVSKSSLDDKVYHDQFAIMTRYISNYVMYKGVCTKYIYWDASRDQEMKYFQDNFENSADATQCMQLEFLSGYDFDWDDRKLSRTFDAGLRPKNQWIVDDLWWSIDGLPIGYESSDPDFEGVCIVAKDLYAWATKSVNVTTGNTLSYQKPQAETYLFVLHGDAVINQQHVSKGSIFCVQSTELEIQAHDAETVIVIKEKTHI